jgi:uncharacterized protein
MDTEARTLVVTGQGNAHGTPDRCVMRLVLIVNDMAVASALSEVAVIGNRAVSALRERGVSPRDVQTTNLSLQESYDRSDKRTKTGHQAALELSVNAPSIEQTGPLLAAVAEVAGDSFRVQGFHLAVADTEPLERIARRQAVDDATARAHQLSGAAGVSLGRILEITEGHVATGRGFRAAALSGGASVPVEPGEVTSTVTVTVTYAIDD